MRVDKASDRKPEAGTERAGRWELGHRFAEVSKDSPAVAELQGRPSHGILPGYPPLGGPGQGQITQRLVRLSLACETLFSKPWRANESLGAEDSVVSDLYLKHFSGAAVQIEVDREKTLGRAANYVTTEIVRRESVGA